MILSCCGHTGQPCFLSSLLPLGSLRAPTMKFTEHFYWKPMAGFEFWPSAPLKKAPDPAAKAQGGFSFSTWILAALQAR